MDNPIYNNGDVVYLRESASNGFLEPVYIDQITRKNDTWIYSVNTKRQLPFAPSYYGDRISHGMDYILYFSETDLITLCQALDLAITNSQNNLNKLIAKRNSLCV